MLPCWLAEAGAPGACDGPMDRAHLIPKQVIKREWKGRLPKEQVDELVWHPSVWRWCCRFHHGQFDNGAFRLPRALVPESVERYAELWELGWRLDRDYGARASS